MASRHSPEFVHLLYSIDELAGNELANKVRVAPNSRFLELFAQLEEQPARVSLNTGVILPHLHPYLLQHQKEYSSYKELCAGFRYVAQLLGQTACTLQFTQLLNGLYAGAPKEIYALWNHIKPLPQRVDGLGVKLANVSFI